MTVVDNPSKRSSSKQAAQLLLAVLNGFSVAISTEDLIDLIPVDKLGEIPVEMLIEQVKQMGNPKEVVESLPLA